MREISPVHCSCSWGSPRAAQTDVTLLMEPSEVPTSSTATGSNPSCSSPAGGGKTSHGFQPFHGNIHPVTSDTHLLQFAWKYKPTALKAHFTVLQIPINCTILPLFPEKRIWDHIFWFGSIKIFHFNTLKCLVLMTLFSPKLSLLF